MQTIEQSKEMAKLACEALADKKGEDIRVIDIAGISVLADYFIIANGTNESQVRALVDNVEEELAKAGYEVKQREGYRTLQAGYCWTTAMLSSTSSTRENRLFYDLERIWSDGKQSWITKRYL